MCKRLLKFFIIGSVFLCGFGPIIPGFADSANKVLFIQLEEDTINPVTAEYISQAIEKAIQDKAQCLVIKLDTPGGLLTSTRLIVKKMLTAKVPIVVYVAPSGAHAGSAGVFITYASHIAAMAPSTNIGAAHPVQLDQEKPSRSSEWEDLRKLIEELKEDKGVKRESKKNSESEEPLVADENPMESKILQDTVAFIRGIAEMRGRNEEWAIESVTKSLSITGQEALEKGVIEIIAQDDKDLLEQLDGRIVKIEGQEVTLQTKEANSEYLKMDARQIFFNILANPNIAYFLMILGFYGLLYEMTHPGFGLPGVLGAIFLILAFYSMQTLPTNYAGLALMGLGIILLVAEAYTPTFGLLVFGGLVCLILGSLLLFESVDPIMRVSISAILTFSASTAVITLFLVRAVLRSQRSKVKSGQEGLIGEIGVTKTDIEKSHPGKIFVHGEIWNATSDAPIKKGKPVEVLEVKGLTLKVGLLVKADPP
ncbi:MAG TPA: nodulation protein NfeD [Candidatus Omnitrophota bacterium]|nr:nodulation protein NfeD [Candidatus Omnitrophota bacterium]